MIVIRDLISLTEFFAQASANVPGLAHFLALSNGHKAINEIEAYYNNDFTGTTCFLQVAENRHTDNGAGLDSLTFLCSLTVATKPDGAGAPAGLIARDTCQKLLLQVIGQVKTALDECLELLEDENYEFSVAPSERMFPIGQMANAQLEGYYIDVDVTIPANHLLFPA